MQDVLQEALRCLGMTQAPPETVRELECTVQMLRQTQKPKYLYRIFPLERSEAGLFLGGLMLPGKTAESLLRECETAALLCCTLGFGFEAMLRTAQSRDMAQAVLLDACGSACVEAGCDEAEEEISARFPGKFRTDRFSPGYGDLPLSWQTELCRLLDAERQLGVHLNDAMLMTPSKTVTAVIGLSDTKQRARIRGCAYCDFAENCAFRKRGMPCET